jgi:hypothetical protein
MVLGIAGPVDLQQSAPNAAKQYPRPNIRRQLTVRIGKLVYPGKMIDSE